MKVFLKITQPFNLTQTIGKAILKKSTMKALRILLIATVLVTISCENEPIDMVDINNFDTITVDSTLFNDIEKVVNDNETLNVTCLDFLYAFTVFVFDGDDAFETSVVIESDIQFSEFLGALDERQSISLSFPILGTNDAGDIVEINTSADLKEVIDSCTKEEELGQCEQEITECYYTIENFNVEEFEGDYMKIAPTGVLSYYHNTEIYSGTWIMFFLGEDLHININLNATEEINEAFNYDWFVISFGASEFSIRHDTTILGMTQQCPEDCGNNTYTQCGTEEDVTIAIFDLDSLLPCTSYIENGQVEPIEVTFYETEEDAMTQNNVIEDTQTYTVVSSPQIIYVRYDDATTAELINIANISLEAEDCN